MNKAEIRLDLIDKIIKMDDNSLRNIQAILQEYESSEIPEWQKEILDKRLQSHDNNPNAGDDWETVKARISAKQ